MNFNRILISAFAAVAFSAVPVAAQVDLSSQRKEVQDFLKVPGHKVDHKGIIINPTPHQLTVDSARTVNIAAGFKPDAKFLADFGGDFTTLNLPKSPAGLKVKAEYGAKAAAKANVKAVKGAYSLNIDKSGVKISAFDKSGVFYALQTLRQLLDSPVAAGGTLPVVAINDYPDLPYRGVVEGFYGNPWSHEVRLSLIDFYGKNKMTDYIFGPKDDPYHSSPYWRLPYPEDQANKIKELVAACKKNHVNFVWAIHPGQDIRWDKADYDSLVGKLSMMYDLGVRSFAIFFDDISGKGADSKMQTQLLNDLTNDFVKAKGDVTNLMICPTDYTELWANPKPTGQLAVYGETLNPDVEVFWTGKVVCSDLTPSTLEFVNSRIKRPALFWWNFPVTDYCRNILLQGPVYGLDTNLTVKDVAGIESNPMEHGEASKLALYGVADYAWNVADYNPIDNWERGLVNIAPEAAEAYRLFAIHSADTQTGYRRDESWETTTFPYNNYTPAQFEALRNEFNRIVKVPEQMQSISNKALLAEINPWLTEFGKLGERGNRTLDLIKIFEGENPSEFWAAYVRNLMSPEEIEAYQAHKIGTMKLQPFYENAMDSMLYAFYTSVAGTHPGIHRPIGSYKNLSSPMGKLMLDNDTTTFYHSGNAQRAGHWIGLDLGQPIDVENVSIYQGRNSVDDVDYFDKAVVEASVDGKEWLPLTDELEGQYVIDWNGKPVKARYVRLRKLESKKSNWAAVRSFRVNPANENNIGIKITSDNNALALLAFDNNPSTAYSNAGALKFSRKEEANSAVFLLDTLTGDVTLKQLNDQGAVIESRKIDTPFTNITFAPETRNLVIEGPARIFEIIQK
ncbi:MAG: beta-N-acetylglucosaminidase domain-containing protein [Paramuribaculum sp.]|nr:beta-N-acetylglucosaminidase domain-containing protein [Paramuribaculum sp.]